LATSSNFREQFKMALTDIGLPYQISDGHVDWAEWLGPTTTKHFYGANMELDTCTDEECTEVIKPCAHQIAEFVVMSRVPPADIMIHSLSAERYVTSTNLPALRVLCHVYIREDTKVTGLRKRICWLIVEAAFGDSYTPIWAARMSRIRCYVGDTPLKGEPSVDVLREIYGRDTVRAEMVGDFPAFLDKAEMEELASGRWDAVEPPS